MKQISQLVYKKLKIAIFPLHSESYVIQISLNDMLYSTILSQFNNINNPK